MVGLKALLLLLLLFTTAEQADSAKCPAFSPLPVPPQWYQPGDLVIGGIVSQLFYHYFEFDFKVPPEWKWLENSESIMNFYQHILALAFAVKEVNESPHILPNKTLGFHIYENYRDMKMTYHTTLELLFRSQGFIPNYKCGSQKNLIAAIGGLDSESSFYMADILERYKIPQLTYGSFASEESEAKEVSFYHMVPKEDRHYTGILQLLLHFGWTWVGLVVLNNNSGERFLQTLESLLSRNGICLASIQRIPPLVQWDDTDFFTEKTDSAKKRFMDTKISTLILYGDSRSFIVVRAFLGFGPLTNDHTYSKVWILTAQINVALTGIQRMWDFHPFHGTILFNVHSNKVQDFHTFLNSIKPYRVKENGLQVIFWEQAFECTVVNGEEFGQVDDACTGEEKLESLPKTIFEIDMSGHSYSIYNAVHAVAQALHTMSSSRSYVRARRPSKRAEFQDLQPWQLDPFLQGNAFNNSVGDRVSFNSHREVEEGFDLMNLVTFPNKSFIRAKVGRLDPTALEGKELVIHEDLIVWQSGFEQVPPLSECNAHCHPGSHKKKIEGKQFCCYDCSLCPEEKISRQKDMDDCIRCPEDEYPNKNHDACLPKTMNFLSYEETLGISLSSIAGSCLLLTALILATFIKHKDTPIVKANNRDVTYALLVSLLLCFLCPLLFLGKPCIETCFLRQSSFGIIFTVAVSCVLAKTLTVLVAFMATRPGSNMRKWVGKRMTNSIILSCSFIQVAICMVWLGTSPPFLAFDLQSLTQEIIVECNEGSILMFYIVLGYMGLLSLICLTVAFFARKLPDSFNEAKFITFCMLVFCSVWVSFFPAYLSTKGKYMVAVEIFSILASSVGLLGCIFFPKCYIILLRPQMNNREQLKKRNK